MASITIQDDQRTISDVEQIREFLKPYGIWYENWDVEGRIDSDASSDEILAAYEPEIQRLKDHGNFVTADVISVNLKLRRFPKRPRNRSEISSAFCFSPMLRAAEIAWERPSEG